MPNPAILIQFEKPTRMYDGGELLNGRVVVVVGSPLTVRGVHISFIGDAHVYWTETRNDSEGHSHTEYYRNDETIVENTITVWGNRGSSAPTLTMPVGQHVFHFSFPIALTRMNGFPLPSSFTSAHGYIKYHVKAHFERPTLRFDTREEELVIIRGAYDLNTDPRSPIPQEAHDGKTVCCWCCASGRIGVILKTNKTGYVPGEVILVHAQVINHSMKDVQPISVRLVQTIHHVSSRGKTRDQTFILNAFERHENLRSGKTHTWDGEGLLVPPTALEPTISKGSCEILQVGYQVQLHVNPSGCSLAFSVETDIILGTVPLVVVPPSPKPAATPAYV